MSKGFLLVTEGLGGSGKTTLCDRIQAWFTEERIPCVRTFEPGGTPAANFLRKLCREGIPDAEPLTPMAEALLFKAARAQHVETVIKPALERGDVVLCDRYMLSTFAFQGIGRGLPLYTLDKLHHDAIGLVPDMTIIMGGDPETFAARISVTEKGSDQFDNWTMERNNRIQNYFESVAKQDPGIYHLVDAEQSADNVFWQVESLLMKIKGDRNKQKAHAPSIKIPPSLRGDSVLSKIVPGKVPNNGIFDK